MMPLLQASHAGGVGGVLNDIRVAPVLAAEYREQAQFGALDFFRNMAVNNSVVPAIHDDGTRTYKASQCSCSNGDVMGHCDGDVLWLQASSPDEEALVKAAASFNVNMMSRDGPV